MKFIATEKRNIGDDFIKSYGVFMVFLPYFETLEAMKMQGLNQFAYHVAISRVQKVARYEQVAYLPSQYCNSLMRLREK